MKAIPPFASTARSSVPRGNPSETVDIQEMACRMAVSNASGKVLWFQDRSSRMRSWGSVNREGSASQQLRDEMVSGFKGLLASSGAGTEAVPRVHLRRHRHDPRRRIDVRLPHRGSPAPSRAPRPGQTRSRNCAGVVNLQAWQRNFSTFSSPRYLRNFSRSQAPAWERTSPEALPRSTAKTRNFPTFSSPR